MGHIRLGNLPRTRKWNQVLALISEGAAAPEVAAAAMEAAKGGLTKAADDRGLVHSFWLLTQIPLAARQADFAAELQRLGLRVPAEPDLFDVTSALPPNVDSYLQYSGGRTDIGEMAQMAATEALSELAAPRTGLLFEGQPKNVRDALRRLSSPNGFSSLTRAFFARFTSKYLAYFLSRELPNFVGGDERFATLREHLAFNDALDLHCRQASRIVEEFSGGWFSKTNSEGGITPQSAAGFIHVALKKIRDELEKGGEINEE